MPPELAQLSGPDGKENVVAQRYLATQGRLVEAGMRLTALRLDARGAWEIDLSNGVTVRLGRRQVDERFDTFMRTALRFVAQRADDIAYVDMRYTQRVCNRLARHCRAPRQERGRASKCLSVPTVD